MRIICPKHQIFQTSTKPNFRRQQIVIAEMIYDLKVLEFAAVVAVIAAYIWFLIFWKYLISSYHEF